MKTKILLVLFFSVSVAMGQNIKGKVLEAKTNRPLDNVTIYFEKGKIGTVTNEKGVFELKLRSALKPDDELQFSIVGYQTVNITFAAFQKRNFILHLSKKTEVLSEVLVIGSQLQKELSYEKLASLKTGVYDFGSVLIGDNIYVIGGDESTLDDGAKRAFEENSFRPGFTLQDFLRKAANSINFDGYSGKLQIYNIENNTWTASKLKFEKRAYHQVLFINKALYILGGKTLSSDRIHEYLDNKIEMLNLKTDQIIVDNINPHQAVGSAAFAYQGNIIVMGGSIKQEINGKKVYTDQSHLYNTATGYWYALPKMTRPKEVSGVIVNNRIYLIGGYNEKPLTAIESYDLVRGEWNKEGDLFEGMETPALASNGNTIYIFEDGKFLTYNVKSRTLNEYKIDLESKGARMHCYQNKLYIVGGSLTDVYNKSPSSRVYSVSLDEFAKTRVVRSKKMDQVMEE